MDPDFDIRLGEALDYFGAASKAVFRPDLPDRLVPGVSACCHLVTPAGGQTMPNMLVLDPWKEPPLIEHLAIEPHLIYPHYVIGLAKGLLLNRVGHIADPSGYVFVESMRDRSFLPDRRYQAHDLRDPAYGADLAARHKQGVIPMPGRYLSLIYPLAEDNWYHWLIENLGRLMAARSLPFFRALKIILPPGLSPARLQSLDCMGIDVERRVIYEGGIWECEELWLPSFGAVRGSVRPEPITWLRQSLVPALAANPPPHPGRKLYISRADAGIRRLANEAAVFERIAPLGFEHVTLSGLDLPGQARLFAEAAVIVAPHGAGLANLLFARPGTQLVELLGARADGSVLRVYHTLGVHCGIRYIGVKCRELGREDGDFVLDPAVLAGLLPALS